MKNKETLEEAAENYAIENWGNEIMFQNNKKHYIKIFTDGVKWQQERSYSEDDLRQAHFEGKLKKQPFDEWFEQFKNK